MTKKEQQQLVIKKRLAKAMQSAGKSKVMQSIAKIQYADAMLTLKKGNQ